MARECFCGCGRRLGFNDRSISKKGAKIEEEVDFIERYLLPTIRESGRSPDGVKAFIEEGRTFREQLVAVIHRELDAGAVDRRRMAAWHGRAKSLISSTKAAAYELDRDRRDWSVER